MSNYINLLNVLVLFSATSLAAQTKEPHPDMIPKILENNARPYAAKNLKRVARPYAEHENMGYLIFSSITSYESATIKKRLARELPSDMKLIVFTSSDSDIPQLKKTYEPLVGSRLHILKTTRNGFWARDGVPIPVYDHNNRVTLIDAKYYHGFEDDKIFASHFKTPMLSHTYYFEGGNFLADSSGNCLIVDNSRVKKMNDQIFKDYYGCKTVNRFPHDTGIGHVDEVIKIIDDQHVITNQINYVSKLKRLGYTVTLMTKARNPIETYVNSVIYDDKVFMPSYGTSEDKKAIAIYESFGLEVIPLKSYDLSNRGKGSIHCITMLYPKMSLKSLAAAFEAEIVE